LAFCLVNKVFAEPAKYNTIELVCALYGYAFQIYYDFSGYTDIAIGSGLLFGYKLPENFKKPYLAVSPADFWNRWHISLSIWFKKYLYNAIAMFFIRRGQSVFHKYSPIIFTMTIIGLWHGANWTFILFGFYWGILLFFEKIIDAGRKKNKSKHIAKIKSSNLLKALESPFLKTFFLFQLICFGWIFFRSDSIKNIYVFLKSLLNFSLSFKILDYKLILLLFIAGCLHFVPEKAYSYLSLNFRTKMPELVQAIVYMFLIGFIMAVSTSQITFIYFKF